MRVSGIENYLGGADNVAVRELLQGDAFSFAGQHVDNEGNPVDITTFTITANVKYYKVDAKFTFNKSGTLASAAFSNWVKQTDIPDKALVVTKTDASMGQFAVLIPDDLATAEQVGAIDATTSVLVAIAYVRHNDGSGTSLSHRIMLVVRP